MRETERVRQPALTDREITIESIRRGLVAVVDDDESMRTYLGETLSTGGYDFRSFSDGATALGWLASGEGSISLLFSDINMPGMNGLDLLRTVRAVLPDLPFVLISGVCDLPKAHAALLAGATDYLLKPVRPADVLAMVSSHVHVVHSERLEAVSKALRLSMATKGEWGAIHVDHLTAIFDALGAKRLETLQHSRRVAAFALLIARDMRLYPDEIRALEIGSLLHDIGKAGIPYNVLMKPGKLTDAEWAIMKLHPELGLNLLRGVSGLDLEAQIVYSHHERFDGLGYPRRLAGEMIPLGARIFAVADTLDAFTSDRCYRRGQDLPAARDQIHRGIGSQFDPAIVSMFDRVGDQEIEDVQQQFPDFV